MHIQTHESPIRLRAVPIPALQSGISLTPRQRELLAYLVERRTCPTYAEMGQAIGAGKSVIQLLLNGLEERGYIRRIPNRERAIEVLKPAPAQLNWTREEGLAFARAWRERMKPHFDALYGPETGGAAA